MLHSLSVLLSYIKDGEESESDSDSEYYRDIEDDENNYIATIDTKVYDYYLAETLFTYLRLNYLNLSYKRTYTRSQVKEIRKAFSSIPYYFYLNSKADLIK